MKKSKPYVSVVVPCYNAEWSIDNCLRSLLNQQVDIDYEIIVVDSSSDRTPEIIREKYPSVKLIHLEQQTFPGKGRNIGVREAQGEIIAFIDSDCRASPKWLSNALQRVEEGYVVGGEIKNGETGSYIGSADHVLTFNEFIPGSKKRKVASMPSCNFICKREVFNTIPPFPEDMITGEDTLFNYHLARKYTLLYDPKVKVVHYGRTNWERFYRHHYNFGVHSAIVRKRTDLPGKTFITYPLLSVFFPLIRTARIGSRLARINPRGFFQFLLTYPVIFLGMCIWSYGWFKEARR